MLGTRFVGAGRTGGGGRAQPETSAAGSGGQRRPHGASGAEVTPSACPVGPLSHGPPPLGRCTVTSRGKAPQRLCGPGPLYGAGAEPAAGTAPRAPRWPPLGELRGWSSHWPRWPRDSRPSRRGARPLPRAAALSHFPGKSKTPLSSPGASGQGARRRWSVRGRSVRSAREPSIGAVGPRSVRSDHPGHPASVISPRSVRSARGSQHGVVGQGPSPTQGLAGWALAGGAAWPSSRERTEGTGRCFRCATSYGG